ncbi:MAG TPA: hypothetical protein VHN11_00355, partial [Xanthobacteraceae bacterium]|nr:hypothetical protein [Xanthobacteraceae bacterium]
DDPDSSWFAITDPQGKMRFCGGETTAALRIIQLEQQNEKLAIRAELLDFMLHFGVEPKSKGAGRDGRWVVMYTISSSNMEIMAFAHRHGLWDTPEQALADCRGFAVKEWGWANRPEHKC